mmetsp:Transcript_13089/g.25388  ORF Transcript_13089/g.25388 Transcript_13089/m.25388 type:complete len:81 (-) Transcript_13089:218-460(-)
MSHIADEFSLNKSMQRTDRTSCEYFVSHEFYNNHIMTWCPLAAADRERFGRRTENARMLERLRPDTVKTQATTDMSNLLL